MLFFYQVFYFSRHCCGFARTSTSYQQTMIIIGNHSSPLFIIQLYLRVNFFQNIIKIIFLTSQSLLYISRVM